MKLITRFELVRLSTSELLGLYRETFNAAAGTLVDNPELRNALASLETIRAEIASRKP